MLKKTSILFMAILLTGCGNLSPRINPELDQKINNQNGKIGEIENNQNSIKNDLFNLRSQSEIHDSQLREVQQGYLNLQRFISSENTNSGIQILSGPGGIMIYFITICIIFVLFMTLMYYKSLADKNIKISNLLTDKIIQSKDFNLHENVLKAASYTEVEKDVYKLFYKKINQQK